MTQGTRTVLVALVSFVVVYLCEARVPETPRRQSPDVTQLAATPVSTHR